MTNCNEINIPCHDCGQLLAVEFQPALTPNQYAVYTDGQQIGYATVHCESCECPLEDASVPAATYQTMPESELQQWREWVAQHRGRLAS
jgi:hypothetical protein